MKKVDKQKILNTPASIVHGVWSREVQRVSGNPRFQIDPIINELVNHYEKRVEDFVLNVKLKMLAESMGDVYG